MYLYMITERCPFWYTRPRVAGGCETDNPLPWVPGSKEGTEILFLLERHSGFIVVRGERENVHVGGRPVERDARTGAREGEGSLIINAICMDTCKKGDGSFGSSLPLKSGKISETTEKQAQD